MSDYFCNFAKVPEKKFVISFSQIKIKQMKRLLRPQTS